MMTPGLLILYPRKSVLFGGTTEDGTGTLQFFPRRLGSLGKELRYAHLSLSSKESPCPCPLRQRHPSIPLSEEGLARTGQKIEQGWG